jgi:sulfur dioxygenase
MLIFRQLLDPQSSTYTYLLGDSRSAEAILIDPVFEQAARDAALINELKLTLVSTVDTHVHADHVTGAWLHRHRLGSRIAISAASGAEGADVLLTEGDRVVFGDRFIVAHPTPGHTGGCMSFVLDDETMVFTGDTLLIRGCGRTDFQQGSASRLYESVRMKLFTLPHGCLVYPAHDYRGLTVSSIGEERAFNPRLGGDIAEGDFTGYMEHLNLPHPKQIDEALPANMMCGKPADDSLLDTKPGWAPLTFTFAGFWEIEPSWVEEHAMEVQVIDVRGSDEFNGPLGRVPGSTPIPLGEIVGRADELSKEKPIVTVCRSGARSAQAVVLLKKAGFADVANMAGGMLRWRSQQLPVEGVRE